MASICLEGLGRRYLPQVPSIIFYLLKDAVLIVGFLNFKASASTKRITDHLFRGFSVFWIGGFIFTLVELPNTATQSPVLGLIGLRAYWLWWIAPVVIAGFLESPTNRKQAIQVLAYLTIGISVLAAFQFVSPPDAAINVYSVVDGETVSAAGSGTVAATGRARVASTFAFISGFSDFTILVPALLLSIGLGTTDKKIRTLSLVATGCSAAALPMSGSRSSVVFGIGVLAITCWSAGLFFTVIGRRIIIGGIVSLVLASVAFPDALGGVQARFGETEETTGRFWAALTILPPVAIMTYDYPLAGVGTGMMQNAAGSMHIYTPYAAEAEVHRYLVELGPAGFCLVWMTKLGIMVALLRAHSILKRAGRRAAAGAALSYAAVTFFGNITFDHIWQALFFVGSGFIIAETKLALESLAAAARTRAQASGPPPVAHGA